MSTRRLFLAVAVFCISFSSVALAAPNSQELSWDNAAYRQEQPHLRPNSPEQKTVSEVAAPVLAVAQRWYGVPFQIFVTNESDPNAYSYFGPRIYVSKGLVHFLKNREELAGVICHEASHVLHHDGLRSAVQRQSADEAVVAQIKRIQAWTHNHGTTVLRGAGGVVAGLSTLKYGRQQEEDADLTGATLCSEAGSNPWGLVWSLQQLQSSFGDTHLTTFMHDHPSDAQRIKRLRTLLTTTTFELRAWSSDQSRANALPS